MSHTDLPTDDTADTPESRRALVAALKQFQTPSFGRSAWQFGTTFAAYLAANVAMYFALHLSTWLALALAIPTGGLVVRMFIIQHDCGHGSFFKSRRLNDLLGRFCSAITFTPYAFWRRQHATHHASFNNLDRRDPGIDLYSTCATLKEFQALSRLKRLVYRSIRHPLVTQFLLPPFVFLLLYRFPFDAPSNWTKERRSVLVTNLALGAVLGTLALLLGFGAVALVQLPIIAVASIVGAWLFTVQHRFEEAQWERQSEWSLVGAAMEGSSYLKLPRVLQWFTGNIGFHHVHHLSARVPNYRLQECHEARGELANVTTLTLRQALTAPYFALFDEDKGHMVRFPRTPRRARA